MSLRRFALSCASLSLATSLSAQAPRLVSRSLAGSPANGESYSPAFSADGRFLAFHSDASDLVARDTNGFGDVFLFDRQAGTRRLVSVNALGGPANAESNYPELSADGRFIVFDSRASNLVPGDTNGVSDIFLRDLQNGRTERVSLGEAGQQADEVCFNGDVSDDGRFVSFSSYATNLVAGDTNQRGDVFVRDRLLGTTTRVSVGANGEQADRGATDAYISGDGLRVVFGSASTNLVAGDTNGTSDAFVRDLASGTTIRVSLDSNGAQANAPVFYITMSPAGGHVLFGSTATNLVPEDTDPGVDLYLHDIVAGTTVLAGVNSRGERANDYTSRGTLSGDGRYVAFKSSATNLVPEDTNGTMDVFVRDMLLGVTTRLSVAADGTEADGFSSQPVISADGQVVAYYSEATNLVPGDDNGEWDVFVNVRSKARAR